MIFGAADAKGANGVRLRGIARRAGAGGHVAATVVGANGGRVCGKSSGEVQGRFIPKSLIERDQMQKQIVSTTRFFLDYS